MLRVLQLKSAILEVYLSRTNCWRVIVAMPVEYTYVSRERSRAADHSTALRCLTTMDVGKLRGFMATRLGYVHTTFAAYSTTH